MRFICVCPRLSVYFARDLPRQGGENSKELSESSWHESCLVFGRRRQASLFINVKQRATELLPNTEHNSVFPLMKQLKEMHNQIHPVSC